MTTPALQETFQNRVEQHKKILYKVCNVYCRDRDSREDLAQEITFQLWRSYWKFDGRCQFSTWMYRIALNVAISFYRSEGARTRLVISDEQHLLDAVDKRHVFVEAIILGVVVYFAPIRHKEAFFCLYLISSMATPLLTVNRIKDTNDPYLQENPYAR